mgnify:CR=1 FL=1
MLKKCFFKSVVAGMVFGALGMVLSCSDNVGLGESVDTEAPTIEIAYPPASSVIRGTFVFAGSWKDDKGVKSVTASITNTATKQTYPANEVILGENNTWSVLVNNYSEENADYVNYWQLPDGKYELGVYATDNAGHKSGTTTRTFEIDNTAPVTVLTSPGSTSTYTAYGSTFSVEGTIADEHTVDSLAVTIYDENGNVLDSTAESPYTETSVQTAGGTSVSLLKFSEKPVTTVQTRYANIYGENRDGGTKKYSCTIYVTDNARLYGEEQYKAFLESKGTSTDASAETLGNETSVFYLNASVYETLLSSVKGYGLSVAELMTIINGTYVASDDTSARAAGSSVVAGTLTKSQLKEVQSLLYGENSVAVDTSVNHLRFSLDPAVNPTYAVSGFALEDSPNGTKNQTVTFIVSPGLDGTQFRPNTFEVYLLNCGAYSDEAGFDRSKYTEFLEDPATYYGAHKDTTIFVSSFADTYTDADTLSSLTATFKLPEIVADNWYCIGIAGHDLDDNELIPDGVFGFIGALSGTPPVVGFEQPVNQAILGSSADLTFTGEITTTEVKLDKVTLTVDVTDVENGSTVGSFKVSNVASDADKIVSWNPDVEKDDNAKFKYAWKFTLTDAPEYSKYKAESGDNRIYMYTVTAEARDASGGENTANRTVTVDTVPPEVTITSVIPSVTGYTDANHSDASAVYVNGTITITGAINEMNLKSASYTVFVDGATVKDADGKDDENYTNVPIKTTQFKIMIDTTALTDDKPIKVVVTAIDRATGTLVTALDGTVGNVGSYSTSALISDGDTEKSYRILQETDRPVLQPTNADTKITSEDAIIAATKNADALNTNIFNLGDKLQATVSDDDGVASVSVGYRKAGSTDAFSPLAANYTASNNSLTSALPSDYGVYEIQVKAVDSVTDRTADFAENGTSTTCFVVAMDDGAPTFSNVQPADNGYYAESFAVTGVITDKSGAVTLQLTSVTDQGNSESYASAVSLNDTADGADFSDKITVPANSQTYRIVYKATDKYNQSKEYAIRYIVDKEAPTVEPPSIENASQSGGWFNSTSPRVTVKAKDNEGGSGVATVKAYVLKDTEVPADLADYAVENATGVDLAAGTKDADGYTPYAGVVSLQQGKNVVIVVVTDQATNKTRVKTDVIQVDTLSPTITLSALSDTLINKTEWENLSSGLTLTPTIVDEGSGVVSAWLDRQNTEAKESDATIKATTDAVTSSSGWTAQLVIPQSALTDGNHVYYVWAKDAAGRTSASEPISFTVDKTPPEIEVNALSNNGLYTEANVTNLDTTARTAKYSIAGSWSDAVSGTETLQYTRNANPTELTAEGEDPAAAWVTIPLSDKAAGVKLSWTNLIDVTESSGNTIAFRAKDTAGNITASDGYKLFTGITFDFSLPVITLTQRPATQTKEQVTIGGTVEDKLALSKGNISIVVTKGTEAQTVTPTITETTTGKAYSFDLTIPANADHSNDGDWTVTIGAKDGAGRDAVQQKVAVKIDTTAPSVEKPTLSTSKGSEKDSVYYFNGSDIPTVAVSASDSGTGIASVAYGIVSGTATAWSDSLVLKNITESADKWTAMQMDSSVSDRFKVNVTDFNTLGEGDYVVFVRVIDSVGNTAYSEGYRVCNDKTLPVLEETGAGDKPVDATGRSFDSGTFTLTGTVSDSNYKELTVTRDTIDGAAPVLTVANGTWTLKQDVADDEQSHTYTYTLTAIDYAGNEAYINGRTVEIDRTAPTVTVEKLNDSAAEVGVFSTKEKNCIFTGKIEETGSGLHKAYALLYTGDTAPADPDAATGIASGETNYASVSVNSDGSFTHTFYGQAEGTYHLKVVAFDKAGNTSSFTPVQVNVDNSAPVSTLNVTGSANGIKQIADGVASDVTISADNWNQKTVYITDGTFTLSGAVTDAFGFSADTIELSVDSTVVSFTSKTDNFNWSQSSGTFNWTYTQPATDGTYTYSLKMTDTAGNERTNEFKVQVDTKAPNILSITAPASNSNQTGDVVLTGQTADEGVGVQKISYQILKGDNPVAINGKEAIDVTASGDAENTLTGSTWKAKIPTAGLTESGHLTLKVTATDYLGHTTSAERVFYRDSTPPVFEDGYPKVTTQVSAGENWFRTSTLTVSAKATDEESDIASISFKVGENGDEIAMTKNEDDTYSSANVVCKEGDNTIYVLAKNNVYDGTKGVTTKTITVHVDTIAPEFSTPAYSGLIYAASNASNNDVTVSGTITEALGLSATNGLVITATRKTSAGGSSDKTEKTYDADSLKEILQENGATTITAPSGATPLTDENNNWSFKLPADTASHSTDGEWTFTITATDQAGNTASTKATVLIDTTAPAWSASGTIASKDYYFTVGGKKYDAANWYKDTNLSITGYYIEDVTGSGISTVNYTITPPIGSSSSQLTGSISPNSATGISKFISEVAGFENGSSLTFTASDEAGNTSTAINEYVINIDSTEPELDSNSVRYAVDGGDSRELGTSTILTNATKAIVITGTVSDAASGIDLGTNSAKTISATRGSVAYDASQDDTSGKSATFTLTLSTEVLQSNLTNGVNTINITFKDVAGNSHTATVATIKKDAQAPEVSITAPTLTSVNKTITIKGSASDNEELAFVDIAISTDGDENYITFENGNGIDATSKHLTLSNNDWSFELDTTTYASTAEEKNITIKVTAQDKAGNTKEAVKGYTISQNGDRPIVKVTNLQKNGEKYVLKYGTEGQLTGTITDDDSTSDAVVKVLRVANVASSETFDASAWDDSGWTKSTVSGVITSSHATYGRTELTLATGEWTYYPKDQADGAYTLYFYVEDNPGTTFATTKADALARPYWQYKTDEKQDNANGIAYSVDGSSPEVKTADVTAYADEGGTTAYGEKETVGTSVNLGGTRKRYARFVFTAADANGVASMTATLSGKDKDNPENAKEITLSTATATDGNFAETSDSTPATWTTRLVDMSVFATGAVTLKVVPTDQNGLIGNGQYTCNVDNTAPVITVTNPSSATEQNGSISITGRASDVGTAGTSDVYFAIPSTDESAVYGGNLTLTSTPDAWTFAFDGTSANNSTLGSYIVRTVGASQTYKIEKVSGEIASNTDIWKIRVYFKAVDALGNESEKTDYFIRYNPNADMAVASITYPSENDYIKADGASLGYAIIGGTIRTTGTVTIEDVSVGVGAVYMQICQTDENGNTDWSDNAKTYVSDLQKDGANVYTVYEKDTAATDTGYTITNADEAWWGIKAVNKSYSWNLNINEKQELNPTSGTNNIAIRVCAMNSNGKMGNWSEPMYIHVDNDAPTATYMLKQFTSGQAVAKATSAHAEKAYSADMYMRNPNADWYIEVNLTDTSGIDGDSITVNDTGTGFQKESYTDSNGKTSYYVYIPITSTSGSASYKLYATDNDATKHNIQITFSLNIDNNAPTVTSLVNNTGEIANTKLRNSNYGVTFGATATDTGSGFSKAAYYFLRDVDGTKTVELPVPDFVSDTTWRLASAAKTMTVSESAVSFEASATTAGDSVALANLTDASDTSGLYGVVLTGSRDSATTFTHELVSDYASKGVIRKGSLVRIGGSYYLITDLNGDTLTFDGEVSESYTDAFFAMAFVVNNTEGETPETWTATDSGLQRTITKDDGDGFVESIKKEGNTWTWDTTVWAGELEDGPLTVKCAAFDVAGNVNSDASAYVMIANNTPRLTKVFLATDLNGDSVYSENEFVHGSVYVKAGNTAVADYLEALSASNTDESQTAVVTVGASGDWKDSNGQQVLTGTRFRISDSTMVTMEFVGGVKEGYEGYGSGNGDVYAYVATSATALTEPDSSQAHSAGRVAKQSSEKVTWETAAAYKGIDVQKTDVTGSLYGSYTESTKNNDEEQYLCLTLWDSTKGTTVGSTDTLVEGKITKFGSQYQVLNIPVYYDFVDDKEPEPSIEAPTAHEDGGHVELSDTLPSDTFKDGSGEYDKDTKVSGKVVFTGMVSDEKRISSITLTSGKAINNTLTEAVTVASYENGILQVKSAASATTGWKFAITETTAEEQFSLADGHKVHWTLTLDSSYVEAIAASDVKFTLTASDGPNSAQAAYQVDIVPYITGIWRSATTKSVVSKTYRSTYGEYPVAIGDTLTVTGYNLPDADVAANATESTYVRVGGTGVATTNQTAKKQFTFSVPDNSGELTVSVNGILSLNHRNNNSLKTNQETASSATNNAKSSTVDGNVLYDNRYIRVWDVGHYFSSLSDGSMPTLATDNEGNLFSTWTLMGSATVQIQKGLNTDSKPLYVCYDQTDKESWLAVDKTPGTTNGEISVIYFPANVGWSGTPDTTGYAQAEAMGGVWAAGIPNANFNNNDYFRYGNFANPVNSNGNRKYVWIANNPYTYTDSKIVVGGWQLASASMRRDVSQFTNARTVRKGDNMHFAYYDTKNHALRYTFQANNATPNEYSSQDNSVTYKKAISGWILVDGKNDGQDRIHGGYEVLNGSDTANSIYSALTTNSVTLTAASNALKGKACTVGIAYTNSAGKYCLELHEAQGDANGQVLTFTDSSTNGATLNGDASGAYKCMGGCVYYGDSNVVSKGATQIDSVGAHLSLDVTSSGNPVVVYYDSDNDTLRIAYSTSATPSMSAKATGADTFTRQSLSGIITGGTYVQAKIDPNNYLHILYRDDEGKLKYVKSTNAPDGANYNIDKADIMDIDTAGTYGTLSLIGSGTKTDNKYATYTPCVSFLNSEGTANGVKYAILRSVDTGDGALSSMWDTMIVPAVSGNYVTGGEYIYTEGFNGWTENSADITDSVNTAECDAIIGYNTGRMDVLFLKREK